MAFMLIAWTLALILSSAELQTERSCTATGDLEVVQFNSKIFPAARKIRILLPVGYRFPANRDQRYSVLYLNDGQNLFDICTSQFSGEEWRVDETVQQLTAKREIEPLIVVGIDNGGKRQKAQRIPSLCR
jgi:enterochelin esterase-like enzyme